jgi:hypothetical protein
MAAQMLEEGGHMLELLGAVVAGVVEALHGQLAHQDMILETGDAPGREITVGICTPASFKIECYL